MREIVMRRPYISIRIMVFAIYNISYVLYMLGFISQSAQLGILIFFCILNGIVFLLKLLKVKEIAFNSELKYGLGFISIFFIISIVFQTINGDFQRYLLDETIRILMPLVNAFLFVNTTKENERSVYFNILLLRFILHFIIQNSGNFNLQTIISVSWANSYSPFETSMAHDFLMLEFYYLYKRQKKKAFICLIFCMLSMKRLSFFLAPFMFVFSNKVKKGKPVNPKILAYTKIIAIASPLLLLFLYKPEVVSWINLTFDVDLNLLMSGRISIYNTLIKNIPCYNGLGSINNFLLIFVKEQYGTHWNGILHNDFLRFYLELTIIGVIALAHSLVEIAKKEYWAFFMLFYILLVAITSHIFYYFSIWIIFYMAVADMYTNNIKAPKNEMIFKSKY